MSKKRNGMIWVSLLSSIALLDYSSAFSQSRNCNASDLATESPSAQQFIAAFEWSVEKRRDFVWPFESLPPAPYESVNMVIEKMPRIWVDKPGKASVELTAQSCLRVNGRVLPRPERARNSRPTYRVSLEKGRLTLSFTLPNGRKMDPGYTLVSIKLYQTNREGSRP